MKFFFGLATIMIFVLSPWFSSANAENTLTENQAAKELKVQYSTDKQDVISGKITNESKQVIKDPVLLVEYHWLWTKEFHPGKHSPGRSAYVSVNKDIQPGSSVSFTYRPEPPLPDRNDGRFMPEVTPAGFTTVLTPQRTASSR